MKKEENNIQIRVLSKDAMIKRLQEEKEEAKSNIVDYCRNKAVELLVGYRVEGEEVYVYTERDLNLEILKFLTHLHTIVLNK